MGCGKTAVEFIGHALVSTIYNSEPALPNSQ